MKRGYLGVNAVKFSPARTLAVAAFCAPATCIADVLGAIYLVEDSTCCWEQAVSWILRIVTAENRERVDRDYSKTRKLTGRIVAGHQTSIVLQLDVAVEDADLSHVVNPP